MSYQRGLGQTYDCTAGSGSACAWYDDIWATQGCLGWYAQCAPTDPFYLLNTKGLIVGGSQVLGSTVGGAVAAGASGAGNSFLGLPTGTVPGWVFAAGFGLVSLMLLFPILKAVR
jgi:hypothetical protein